MTARALLRSTVRPQWLIESILVKGQPAVLGGAKKTLKTSLVIDLALSLALGRPFLGHDQFSSDKPLRVCLLSGESGLPTIQSTIQRQLAAKGVKNLNLEQLDNLCVGFRLPQFSQPASLEATQELLASHRPSVLIIDPLYLCLLAGKARVRMMDRTKRDDGSVRDAYTIHQFLMRHKWLNPENFALKLSGGEQHGAPTVIIDEASMIPMDLLGVLFRALDLNKVSRLILVGDPNQLPPIGPGRPLVDIIAWLEADDERKKCFARLEVQTRCEEHDGNE